MRKQRLAQNDFLTTGEVAKILRLSTTSVQKMVNLGNLKGWVTQGGHRRVSNTSVINYCASRNIRITYGDSTVVIGMHGSSKFMTQWNIMISKMDIKCRVKMYEGASEMKEDCDNNILSIILMDVDHYLTDANNFITTGCESNRNSKATVIALTKKPLDARITNLYDQYKSVKLLPSTKGIMSVIEIVKNEITEVFCRESMLTTQ